MLKIRLSTWKHFIVFPLEGIGWSIWRIKLLCSPRITPNCKLVMRKSVPRDHLLVLAVPGDRGNLQAGQCSFSTDFEQDDAAPDYQCRSFATASCSLCSRSSPFYPRYHLTIKVNDKSAQSEGSLTCSSKNIVLPGTPGHCLDGRLVSCDRVHRRLPGLNSDNNAQWQSYG